MKVLFDNDIFSLQRVGGISRYFSELIQRLPSHGFEPDLFYGFTGNLYLQNGKVGTGLYLPMPKSLGYVVNTLLQAPKIAATGAILFHKTYYTGLRAPRQAKVIITVHDMIWERFPERYGGMSKCKRAWCERADHIITVSDATRRDLLELFHVDEKKVTTVHHGVSAACAPAKDVGLLPEQFLLYVGNRSLYKNFDRLVEGCAASLIRRELFLVCFGGGAFTQQENAAFVRLGISGRVRHVKGGDDLLAACYQRAIAFVYPSCYEGFGLPLLEAMLHRCPVICSDIPPFVEVAGDAAVYFDPSSGAAIAECLESTLSNAGLRGMLQAAGDARTKLFSFDRCARETATVYAGLT